MNFRHPEAFKENTNHLKILKLASNKILLACTIFDLLNDT